MRRLGMTITILYPFLIFTALGVAPTRLVSVALAVLLAARSLGRGDSRRLVDSTSTVVCGLGTGVALVLAFALDSGRWFLFFPALVNLGLLVTFARTLIGHDTSRVGAWLRRFLPRPSGS